MTRHGLGLGGRGGLCPLSFPTQGSAICHPHSLTERARAQHDAASLGHGLAQSCSTCICSGTNVPHVGRQLRTKQAHSPPLSKEFPPPKVSFFEEERNILSRSTSPWKGPPATTVRRCGPGSLKTLFTQELTKLAIVGKYAINGESQYNKGRPPQWSHQSP